MSLEKETEEILAKAREGMIGEKDLPDIRQALEIEDEEASVRMTEKVIEVTDAAGTKIRLSKVVRK